MKDNNLGKLGGICSILVGVSYLLLGALVIFLVLAAMPGFLGSIFAQLTQPVPGYY